ncbi:MAG: flagellar filament capping protein FliD [Fimbriimonadaceae bacterium]|nr:flagellar filament capping protein FliD [Fimbriimonadaceae bacterium]
MSLGGSLSGVSFSGLGSGIDTQSIVSQLMQVESIPLRRLQARRQEIEARELLYSGLRDRVSAFRDAVNSLQQTSVYQKIKASSSDIAVATVSADATASAGGFTLAVSKLAQGEKFVSTAFASASDALGLTGSFLVNGKKVDVTADENLQQIAGKINRAGAQVSATVVNGGPNQVVLSISGSQTGAGSKVSFAPVSGSVLPSLGLFGAGLEARHASAPSTARGLGLTSKTAPLGTLIGSSAAGNLTISGQDVAVDFAVDSLETIASKINAGGTGVTASVVEVTNGSAKSYHLEVAGAAVPSGLTDGDSLWQQLGVLRATPLDIRQQSQDAEFTVDGIAQRSATNTVTGVVQGVTLTLLAADVATPKTTQIGLERDTAAVKDELKKLVDAYNGVTTFIQENSSFDSDTFESGPLFGDSVARQVEQNLFQTFSLQGSGVGLGNLASLGLSLGSSGTMELNEAALDTALSTDPDAIRRTMSVDGSTTGANLSFLGATARSRTSASGYVVNVTQAATKAAMLAASQATLPWSATEKLTFSGTVFGNSPIEVTIGAGSSLAQVVSQLNSDTRLAGRVVASVEGGALRLDSARFGTPGDFTAVSDLDPAADNSGLGKTGGNYTAALDIVGTINGETADGIGQLLTGKKGNLTTEGVQLLYSGSATGDVGTVSFTVGWATRAVDALLALTDPVNGLMEATDQRLEDQLEDTDRDIASMEARLTIRQETLRRRFLAMEQAMSAMQRQSAGLQQFGSQP